MELERYAFISRHEPTQAQLDLALRWGIDLVPVGDADAFEVTPEWVESYDNPGFDGVIVVHPAAAMRLAKTHKVGVFRNANRAGPGEPPKFEAQGLYLYDLTH